MNRFAAAGIVLAAAHGARILVLNHNQTAARDSFDSCMAIVESLACEPLHIRRANGAERITFSNGGGVIFRSALANLRGHVAYTVFLDSGVHVEPDTSLHRDLIAITATGGDIVRS